MLGENGCFRSEGKAREDNLAALGGETKIGCSNGQWLLERSVHPLAGSGLGFEKEQ